MQQFMNFVVAHWALWSLLLIIVVLLLWTELRQHVTGISRLNPQQAVALMNGEDALVLDVRPAEAFNRGHILRARNIPMSDLAQQLKKLQKFKSKPILVVCQKGVTSSKAGVLLRQHDFIKVYSLSGGLEAWSQANLPITK
jgi:rhodanese-related sulfurtransferase